MHIGIHNHSKALTPRNGHSCQIHPNGSRQHPPFHQQRNRAPSNDLWLRSRTPSRLRPASSDGNLFPRVNQRVMQAINRRSKRFSLLRHHRRQPVGRRKDSGFLDSLVTQSRSPLFNIEGWSTSHPGVVSTLEPTPRIPIMMGPTATRDTDLRTRNDQQRGHQL